MTQRGRIGVTLEAFLAARLDEDEDEATSARFWETRPMREVAAKRAILAECDLLLKVGIAYPDEVGPESAATILRHFAAIYSDHPDYDPAWAVQPPP